MRDDLLLYYERELDYLRKSGDEFAKKHPKIASRLVLESTKCEDPHVERLLEAFAFLAARVHLKMDDEFPEITEALLTVVYPQLVRPIPSMSVVEFQPDPQKGKLTGPLKIDRNTPLNSKPVNDVPCVFRTCYDTTLWPLSVTAAELRTPSNLQTPVKTMDSALAIRVELECAQDVSLAGLRLETLRFYLDGEGGLIHTLYELLFSRLNRILLRDPSSNSQLSPITLPASALTQVGFGADEGMLPYSPSSFAGHRLLMEYFSFPEKFFFVDLSGLAQLAEKGFKNKFEIIFLLSGIETERRVERLQLELSKKTFRLGCTPVVNLFPQVAEPIQFDQRKYEYPVTPNRRHSFPPYSTEVFSIDEVAAIDSSNQKITNYEPFYSLRHSIGQSGRAGFWLARRRPSTRANDDGTEVYLSLVDLATATVDPEATSLFVRTTCTNRDLPARLPFGNQETDFYVDGPAAMKRIIALRKPTVPVRPELGKSALWRLISHLSLNYLSLVDQGKDALQEILRLYDVGRTAYSKNVIQSILRVSSRPHFTRLISEQGVSFARGLQIEMEIDEDQFTGSGAFLFASVLERFLGLTASLNSFTQLKVVTPQRKDALHTWAPRSGRRLLI